MGTSACNELCANYSNNNKSDDSVWPCETANTFNYSTHCSTGERNGQEQQPYCTDDGSSPTTLVGRTHSKPLCVSLENSLQVQLFDLSFKSGWEAGVHGGSA